MNERLPYEEQIEQQWDDLPLPDETISWEDMKRRLEEGEDNGILPFWLRGCGLWGLLLVVLVGIGWWLYRQTEFSRLAEAVTLVVILSSVFVIVEWYLRYRFPVDVLATIYAGIAYSSLVGSKLTRSRSP